MKKSINVLAFPGNNCEIETARMIRAAGFDSEILLWNTPPDRVAASDGIVIPGGFSYEDRGRTGVLAAKEPVAQTLLQMASEGKPILGICNGAQILVEMGLVPGFHPGKIEMTLGRNRRQKDGKILGTGYYHDFVFIKPNANCAFTQFAEKTPLRVPVAHGEGRFVAAPELFAVLEANDQIPFLYCDAAGKVDEHFPVNPNGSLGNAAAVCNPAGNVMALMPHPERVEQGIRLLESLHSYFEKGLNRKARTFDHAVPSLQLEELEQSPLEIYVALKITDTTEKSVQRVARRIWNAPSLTLSRFVRWSVETSGDPLTFAAQLLESGELHNANKEVAFIRIGDDWYDEDLTSTVSPFPGATYVAMERDDIVGEERSAVLSEYFGQELTIHSSTVWGLSEVVDEKTILESNLLANPVSWRMGKDG